jgi:dTMP kinase
VSTERGLFIVLEGGEASGTSTQARLLANRLDAVLTREPGGTSVGEDVRALVLDPMRTVSDRAEALLFAAARAQHVAEVIEPALGSGRHVVCDRFIGSSLAYQSFGRGLPLDEVEALSRFAVGGNWPDLNVLLVVPAATSAARLGARDRLEQAGEGFHDRVAQGFASLESADPDHWIRVDGTGSIDEVTAAVWGAVCSRLDVG